MLHDKVIAELTRLCSMLPKVKEMEPDTPNVKTTLTIPKSSGLAQTAGSAQTSKNIKTSGASVEPLFPSSTSTSSKPKPKPKPHNDDKDDDDKEDKDDDGDEDWKTIHDKLVCHLKCVCSLMCKLEKMKPKDLISRSLKLNDIKLGSTWQNVSPPKSDDDWQKTHEKLVAELKKVCCLLRKLEDMTPPDDKKKTTWARRTLFSAAPHLTKQFEHHFHDEHHGEPEHHVEAEQHDQRRHFGGIVPEHHAEEEHHDEPEHHLEHEHHANGDEKTKKKDDINKFQSINNNNTTTTKKKRARHAKRNVDKF